MNEINFSTLGFDPSTTLEAEQESVEDSIITNTLEEIAGKYKFLEDVNKNDKNVHLLLQYSGHNSWDMFCNEFNRIDDFFFRKEQPEVPLIGALLLAVATRFPKITNVDEESIEVITLLDQLDFTSWSDFIKAHQKECDAIFIQDKTVEEENINSPRNIRRRVAEKKHLQLIKETEELQKVITSNKSQLRVLGEKIASLKMEIEMMQFSKHTEEEMLALVKQKYIFETKANEANRELNAAIVCYGMKCYEDRIETSKISALSRTDEMAVFSLNNARFALRLIGSLAYATGSAIYYEERNLEFAQARDGYVPVEPTMSTGGGVYETDEKTTKSNQAIEEMYEFYATLQMMHQEWKDRLPINTEVNPLPKLADVVTKADAKRAEYVIQKGIDEAAKRNTKRTMGQA